MTDDAIQADEEFEIEIEPDVDSVEPESPPVEKVADPKNQVDDNDEIIKSLNAKVIAAQKQAELEREQRVKAEKTVIEKEVAVQESHYSQITSALDREKLRVVQLKEAYEQALASSDAKSAVDLAEELYDTKDRIKDLVAGKVYLENQAREAANRPKVELPDDPTERFIVQTGLRGRDADWIRDHSDLIASDAGVEKIKALHNAAVHIKGLKPGSDAYYKYFNDEIDGPTEDVIAPAPVRKSVPSAPVSRSTGVTGGAAREKVRLTQTQMDYIASCPPEWNMTPQKYIKNMRLLEAQDGKGG